jgi:hypothetical protein
MPLPHASARKLVHTRIIDCRGYERDDGMFDIDGRLTDTKAFHWIRRESNVGLPAGEPVHDMRIRITVDLDMKIHDAIAVTDASPYKGCNSITPNFSALRGVVIQRGWTKDLRAKIGGAAGCTHLWELLGRVATVAMQSTVTARDEHKPVLPPNVPYQFNSCHMYTADSLATLERWPHMYKGPKVTDGKVPLA